MVPTRVLQAVRPNASAGVLAAAACVAATFSATPLILPTISESFDVSLGTTSAISVAQVGAFALASFAGGRLFRPTRTLHRSALAVVAGATFASAFVPAFPVLVATRLIAGLGLGLLTWIAWADASRFRTGIAEVASVAPLTAAVASPIIGWLVEVSNHRGVFLALGGLALTTTVLPVDFAELPRVGRQVSRSRSNRVLLGALAILSTGGSAVFIFVGATAVAFHSLQPATLAWGLTLNAVTGVAATRFTAKQSHAPLWLAATGLAALAVGLVPSPIVLFAALALWGFAFWMAIPAIFVLLANASLSPHERTGDAQAVMALGRVFGPLVGALALGVGGFGGLSFVGGGLIGIAALIVMAVARRRATHGTRVEALV